MSKVSQPRIAVALGAGGARGLAQLSVLAALEDMQLKPALIIGSSIGAVIGAAYASGMPALALQQHVAAQFGDRARMISRLLEARVGKLSDIRPANLWSGKIGNPVLVDGERLLDLFWPTAVPDHFEALEIAFTAVTTDYHLRCERRISSGPLTPAVAASMAIPGLVRPVVMGGHVLIDGGAANPLPYDDVPPGFDLVIAVDVGGGAASATAEKQTPGPVEAMIGASQILMNRLVQRMIDRQPPGLLIRPPVDNFGGLEFFRAKEIMAAGDSIKDFVKRRVTEKLKG